MRLEEAGCYLEINMATGNVDRIATDPELLEHHLGQQGINIEEACGGFCQHSRPRCHRIRPLNPEATERQT